MDSLQELEILSLMPFGTLTDEVAKGATSKGPQACILPQRPNREPTTKKWVELENLNLNNVYTCVFVYINILCSEYVYIYIHVYVYICISLDSPNQSIRICKNCKVLAMPPPLLSPWLSVARCTAMLCNQRRVLRTWPGEASMFS